MNTRTKLITICVSLLFVVAIGTPSAKAVNMLVDPGFESNPLTTAGNVLTNFPGFQGVWGVEAATITGVDGGVTPAQGVRMLRMVSDGLVATQAFQTTDVSSQAALIDSGAATVSLNAQFNVGSSVPAAGGSVLVAFFTAANYGSLTGNISNGMVLDNSSNTWETILVGGAVPVGTRWLMSQVAYNNASLVGNPGYVDAADLRLVPEPATLSLLALGGLAIAGRRRKRRAAG